MRKEKKEKQRIERKGGNMSKIKEIFGNFFKWLFRFVISLIPYALMIGWVTSCLPRHFGEHGMKDSTMGIIYFALLMLYIYSI